MSTHALQRVLMQVSLHTYSVETKEKERVSLTVDPFSWIGVSSFMTVKAATGHRHL